AEWHLEKALPTRPSLHLPRGILAVLRGDRERAKREGEMARDYFARCSRLDPDDHLARLKLAESCAFLTDFAGAAAVLEQGVCRHDAHLDDYRRALAQLYAAWSDSLPRDGKSSVGERLALLEKGLAYDAGNDDLLDRLLKLTEAGGAEAEKVRAALRE